jgi:hypothetical protein
VRLIDPNLQIGFSQPIYDIGKLYNWAEQVGWATANPSCCVSHWLVGNKAKSWSLSASLRRESAAAEKRRKCFELAISEFAERYRPLYGADYEKILAVSIASAHLGLTTLFPSEKDKHVRRFVFAHALKHLKAIQD